MPQFFLSHALAALLGVAALVPLGGCAGRPGPTEIPIIEQSGGSAAAALATGSRLDALLPADVLLLGEQHDAAEHQQIGQQVIAHLAARGLLAALTLEMADAGTSTAALKPSSTEEQTRSALKWNDKGWPWKAYGPAVMTAVRAGVPVLGANLPRGEMKTAMGDDLLDSLLPGPALKAQQQLVRLGHCNLLPESQVNPMARVQIARDISMAQAVRQAAFPGKVLVLLTGSRHADRTLGVPQHLPASLKIKSVLLRAGAHEGSAGSEKDSAYDSIWSTPALPDIDYCAGLREQFPPRSGPADGAAKTPS